jgi:hypothetical protein
VNHKQIRDLIDSTLKTMRMYSEDASELVFLTGLVESKYEYIKQLGTGPARSFWQVEPFTAKDSIENYLFFRKKKLDRIADAMSMDSGKVALMSMNDLDQALWTNIATGIVFCRLKYWRVPHKIPNTVKGKAKYWKKWYNTEGGAGTVEHFLESIESRKD